MKIISVGDNVADVYIDQQTYYPGGNAVNVAVNCKRFGAEKSAYLGIFGDDGPAEHIRQCLSEEGVDYIFSRKMYAPSGKPQVHITAEGDRVFLGGPQDTAQHVVRLKLTEKDLEYISAFDICHTSLYSSLEPELEKLSKICRVSYDFSDEYTLKQVTSVSHLVTFAFFSGSGRREEEIEELLNMTGTSNIEIIGITLGAEGAIFSRGGRRYLQPVKPVEIVDTMGAGDSFIAGFLVSYYDEGNMERALDFAAECSAASCSFHGGFGHPHPFGDTPLT